MENKQQSDQVENLPQPLLDVREVAHILHISRSNCYFLMARGLLPTICIGKCKRVQLQDLQDYISRNRFTSNNS